MVLSYKSNYKNNTTPNKKSQVISTQKCNKCGEAKSPKDFYPYKKSRCKECLKRKTRAWYKNNPQKAKKSSALWRKNHPQRIKELHAKYRANPDYKKKQAEFYRQWYAENGRQRAENWQDIITLWCRLNPKSRKAYDKVAHALKTGELKKPIHCSRCGVERKLLGHHDDYELPLEVKWLCYSCHKKLNHFLLLTPKSNMMEKSI